MTSNEIVTSATKMQHHHSIMLIACTDLNCTGGHTILNPEFSNNSHTRKTHVYTQKKCHMEEIIRQIIIKNPNMKFHSLYPAFICIWANTFRFFL